MAQPIYLDPELQGLERQKQLAQALQQRGMKPLEGQMVSGRYVAPSWTQYLANAFDVVSGGQGVSEAEKGMAAYQQKQQELAQKNIADALRLSKGGEETVYGAGMEGPTKEVKQIAPDTTAAISKLLRPNATAMETSLGGELLKRQFKEPKWEKASEYDPKTGVTNLITYDSNSPNPESTKRIIGVEKPMMSAKDIAELRDKGIAVGGGMPSGASMSAPMGMPSGSQMNAPVGQPMARQPIQGQPVSYTYNPSLSPAQNRELQGKFVAENEKNIKNARESFNVIKDAADIFNTGTPTSGGFKNIGTGIAEFFDIPTQAADADAKLTILGEKLTAQVPRFEGPQSDKDTASYRAAAGDLGNASKTINTRMSALKTLIDLNKKYYPQGDWDKIDLAGPIRTRQTFTSGSKTVSPTEFVKGLNPQDQEAFNWARRNPNDPRSTEIKKRLGIQ